MEDYQLLDFGDGRRLERLGSWLLDRPAPGTEELVKGDADLWQQVDARYEGERAAAGQWTILNGSLNDASASIGNINFADFALSLRLAPSGQVGVFPEQAENWSWIDEQVRAFQSKHQRPPRVLNLFAYTGGSTLAAASAGGEVAHVDSSQSVVNWARENAAQSNLEAAPIRWLVEDATRFVERELRRGNSYDGIILDPPSYGHGGGKRIWKIEQHLAPLLANCLELGGDGLSFLLLTAHTPEFNSKRLEQLLRETPGADQFDELSSGCLEIKAADGRRLMAGNFVRATSHQ